MSMVIFNSKPLNYSPIRMGKPMNEMEKTHEVLLHPTSGRCFFSEKCWGGIFGSNHMSQSQVRNQCASGFNQRAWDDLLPHGHWFGCPKDALDFLHHWIISGRKNPDISTVAHSFSMKSSPVHRRWSSTRGKTEVLVNSEDVPLIKLQSHTDIGGDPHSSTGLHPWKRPEWPEVFFFTAWILKVFVALRSIVPSEHVGFVSPTSVAWLKSHDGSMYGIYGNIYHQYTPFMLLYIPAPWILWESGKPGWNCEDQPSRNKFYW